MLQAVIFDMDGVLIDSEPLHCQATNDILAPLGYMLSTERFKRFCGSKVTYVWETLCAELSLKQPPLELAAQKTARYLEILQTSADLVPIAGVREFLAELRAREMRLAVASSSPLSVVETSLKAIGITDLFAAIVSGDHITNGKPAPDIFLYAAGRLNTPPANCIVVEDAANGVMAAKAAGIKCAAYINPHSGNQDLSLADSRFRAYSEINYSVLAKLIETAE